MGCQPRRARRYPADHPAFAGRDLTPGLRLEELVGINYLPGVVHIGDTFVSDLNETIPQCFYRFGAEADQMIEITVTGTDADALDPYLILADDNRESLLEDDNSGDGQSAYLQYQIPDDGEYYIIVGSSPDAGDANFGGFSVTLSTVEETEE